MGGSPYAKPILIIFDKNLVMDFKQNKSTGVLWFLMVFDGFIFADVIDDAGLFSIWELLFQNPLNIHIG